MVQNSESRKVLLFSGFYPASRFRSIGITGACRCTWPFVASGIGTSGPRTSSMHNLLTQPSASPTPEPHLRIGPGWTQICLIAKAVFELLILLPPPPTFWVCRPAPPGPATVAFYCAHSNGLGSVPWCLSVTRCSLLCPTLGRHHDFVLAVTEGIWCRTGCCECCNCFSRASVVSGSGFP